MDSDEIDKLCAEPIFLLFLFQLEKNDDTNLPDFIDRGKTAKKLINLNIIKEEKPKKHMHIKKYKFTKHGKNIYQRLKEKKCLDFFQVSTEYKDKESFIQNYNQYRKDLKINLDEVKINDLPGINNLKLKTLTTIYCKNFTYSIKEVFKTKYKINSVEFYDESNKVILSIDIYCPKCHNKIDLEIDLSMIDFVNNTSYIKIDCSICAFRFNLKRNLQDYYYL